MMGRVILLFCFTLFGCQPPEEEGFIYGNVVQVSNGFRFSCGLNDEGFAWCSGTVGQWDATPPIQFTQIEAGTYDGCGVDINGWVWCWRPDTDPIGPLDLGDVVDIELAISHVWALRSDGLVSWSPTVGVWGYPYSLPDRDQAFSKISCSDWICCGIKAGEGTIDCWGTSIVEFPDIVDAVDIRAGNTYACVILSDGAYDCRTSKEPDYYPRVSVPADQFDAVYPFSSGLLGVEDGRWVAAWYTHDPGVWVEPNGDVLPFQYDDFDSQEKLCGIRRGEGVPDCVPKFEHFDTWYTPEPR